MAHDIVRLLDGPIIYRATSDDFGTPARLSPGPVRVEYYVDTGMVIFGDITENNLAAGNTRVVLIDLRTMSARDAVLAVGGSYYFRSVPESDLGYLVVGLDLDGIYQPVCQAPLFPIPQ